MADSNAWARNLILGHSRRFAAPDVERSEDLRAVADWFARTYEGTNSFVRDMQRWVMAGRSLTSSQARGVLNVARVELAR